MVRNAILLISTVAVLLLLFVGYSWLFGGSTTPGDAERDAVSSIPQLTEIPDEKKLFIEGIPIEPGQKMAYVNYDPITGQAVRYFKALTWEKVPGTQNEIRVTNPEVMMRLPSGMIVTITADGGQIKPERTSRKDVLPKFGSLEGQVRIVIDRGRSFERTPLSERPEDQVTIEMERLEFDLDLGELRTERALRVTSTAFDITGTGLHLIWNEADNRVEKLLIRSGGKMELEAGLAAATNGSLGTHARAGDPPPVSQPESLARRSSGRKRAPTTYQCELTGGVTVGAYRGDQPIGGLQADEMTLLFDTGVGSRGLPEATRTAGGAPTASQETGPSTRLIVEWQGRLLLNPVKTPRDLEQPRRHVEARGQPVTISRANGSIRCGRLVLHEESNRLWLHSPAKGLVEVAETDWLWLYPAEYGPVEIPRGPQRSASAASIFADLDHNIVKLIGDETRNVSFAARSGPGPGASSTTIECNLWAELHLAAAARDENTTGDVFDNPLGARVPESAVFVGDVQVETRDQVLAAHRLEARFRQDAAEPASDSRTAPAAAESRSAARRVSSDLQDRLEQVVAIGDVCLTVRDSSERRGWLGVLTRRIGGLERAVVRALSGSPRTRIGAGGRSSDSTLECAGLRLDFGLIEGEPQLRKMHSTGAVRILNHPKGFAARGREVTATFVKGGEIRWGKVTGSEAAPARVRARAYGLRGGAITVDGQGRDFVLCVDGCSRLAFRSRRSFQGLIRSSAEPITVTSTESMRLDTLNNDVQFAGEVVAGTRGEQLLADKLLLKLADVEPPPPSGWAQANVLFGTLRRRLLGEAESSSPSRALFGSGRRRGSGQKELVQLDAINATLQAETYAPGDDVPLLHQSITAPTIRVYARLREICTENETALLMTDRRPVESTDPTRASLALGVPTALLDQGPSQTALSCRDGLRYTLGEEGPGRRDSVLMKGLVVMRHVAGLEMVNLEQMFPQLAQDPAFLKNQQLNSRNATLECGQLEVILAVPDAVRGTQAALGLRPPLELSLINASKNVYLCDQRDDSIREIYAHQVEFDRASQIVRVLGNPEAGLVARVYDENRATNRLYGPIEGYEFIIDLAANTIRGDEIRGRAGG